MYNMQTVRYTGTSTREPQSQRFALGHATAARAAAAAAGAAAASGNGGGGAAGEEPPKGEL
jgi:hypothetical protein